MSQTYVFVSLPLLFRILPRNVGRSHKYVIREAVFLIYFYFSVFLPRNVAGRSRKYVRLFSKLYADREGERGRGWTGRGER
jgi:hypothetical protein